MSLEISNSVTSTGSSESEEAIIIVDDDKMEATVHVDENSNNLDLTSSIPVNLTIDDVASLTTSIIDVEDVEVVDKFRSRGISFGITIGAVSQTGLSGGCEGIEELFNDIDGGD